MTQDELNRFLLGVRRTRLVDYLAPEPGETLAGALDRRIRWAARVRNQPEIAAEASFLLQHQDALRAEIKKSSTAVDEDWVEFADAGDEGARPTWGGARPARESLEFDTSDPFLSNGAAAPAHGAQRAPAPLVPPTLAPPALVPPAPRPAAISRPSREVVVPDRTPTPYGAPMTEGRRSPSPLLERARRGQPSPHLGRPRESAPQPTPSPPLMAARAATPTANEPSPRPTPARWASSTPASRRSASPTPAPSSPLPGRPTAGPSYGSPAIYGAPTPGTPPGAGLGRRLQSATPAPPRGASTTPAPAAHAPSATPAQRLDSLGGFDVRVTGGDRFVRSNDPYGGAQVVYEPELDPATLRGAAATPPSAGPKSREERPADILGNLRSQARTGQAAPPPQQRPAGRRPGLPAWAPWAMALTLATVGLLVIAGIQRGNFNAWLGNLTPAPVTGTGAAYQAPAQVQPGDALIAPPVSPLAPPPLGPADPPTGPTIAPVTAEVENPAPKPDELKPQPKPRNDRKPEAKADPKPEVKVEPPPVPEVKPTEPEPPVAPPAPLAGAWQGNLGAATCVVDLKQRGEILEGAVTVNGNRIRVQGRYNAEKRTVYLKGVEDENITFRGDFNGSDITGTGKLGAGKLPETWRARK